MHSYCITLFVSRNGFIGVEKVLPLENYRDIDIDSDDSNNIAPTVSQVSLTDVDSIFLTCSITNDRVHILEDSFASNNKQGQKRKLKVFVKLPHLQMWSLLEAWQGLGGACPR